VWRCGQINSLFAHTYISKKRALSKQGRKIMDSGFFLFVVFIAALLCSLIIWLKRRRENRRARFSSLQWRMTFSYIWITIASVLVFTLLISSIRLLLVPLVIIAGLIFWLKNRHTMPRRSWRERLGWLRPRMTHSYIWSATAAITVGVILLTAITIPSSPATSTQQAGSHADSVALVKQVADHFASSIEQQARGQALSNDFPYPLGQPLDINPDDYRDVYSARSLLDSNLVPYLPRLYPNQPVTFALLIAPGRRILSSSYPARYPIGGQSAPLLPEQESWITRALNGKETVGIFAGPDGEMVYAAASIFDQAHRPVGAIYVQVPLATLIATSADFLTTATLSLGISSLVALLLLIFLTPLGGIFGFISTRSLVKRLKRLASATTLVADGDYQQRLPVGSKDEIGQLEQQFNRMAEQLGESTTRQQKLAEENARLAERSRISRELHDAISQDLFSLSMLAGGLQSALPADSPLQRQAAVLEQTTTNTIREMRALLLELRPTRLEQLGLVEALEELAAAYSTRLGMRVKTELVRLSLEARKEHTILRIAQEALSNAARHASATEISMSLARQGNMVLFRLRDNGRGFQADSESSRHGLGLRLMQERVQELHGTSQLTSQPDQGTALEVLLPLEEDL